MKTISLAFSNLIFSTCVALQAGTIVLKPGTEVTIRPGAEKTKVICDTNPSSNCSIKRDWVRGRIGWKIALLIYRDGVPISEAYFSEEEALDAFVAYQNAGVCS